MEPYISEKKPGVESVQAGTPVTPPARVRRELLVVLQQARSRLAIAVAAESKITPPHKWRLYFETDEQIRRWVRKLRSSTDPLDQDFHAVWRQALDTLGRIFSGPGPRCGTSQLCALVGEVIASLDRAAEQRAS